MAGEWVVCKYVVPEVNKMMDDSKISFEYQEKNDGKTQQLFKNTYKDYDGRGQGKTSIIDLTDGVFTIGASETLNGSTYVHLWDKNERDHDILPRTREEASQNLIKNLNYENAFTTLDLSYQDSKGEIKSEKLEIPKYNGNKLNPDYQTYAAMELAGVIRAKDSPEASKKALDMATRHLLECQKNKDEALKNIDEKTHKDISYYQTYIDIYKNSLDQYRVNHKQWESSKEMKELESAIKAGEEFLKHYNQNYPQTIGVFNKLLTDIKNDQEIQLGQNSAEALAVLQYIQKNSSSNPELNQLIEIGEKSVKIHSSDLKYSYLDIHARQDFGLTDFMKTIQGQKASPHFPKYQQLAVDFSNLSTPETPKKSFEEVQDLAIKVMSELEKKQELMQRLSKMIDSNLNFQTNDPQEAIINHTIAKLLEHIKKNLNFLETLSPDRETDLKESFKQEFLEAITTETHMNAELKKLQKIPQNATKDDIKKLYQEAFEKVFNTLK
jgi:hypothetical protein